MNASFEWGPLFTAEKFNERPSSNGCSPQTRKGVLIWKFEMPQEALIHIACMNDEIDMIYIWHDDLDFEL